MSGNLPPFSDLDGRPGSPDFLTGAVPPRRDAGLDEPSRQDEQVVAALAALGPNDALEAMVAGQAVVALHNGSACFHAATAFEFVSKEAAALRREGLAHQRVMLSAARLLARLQRRSDAPKPAAAQSQQDEVPEHSRFVGPLPPEFERPVQHETVGADGRIVPPPRYDMPLECLPLHLQEVYAKDPSLRYLRENWPNYRGWENMTQEERLKMFGYKHSETAKRRMAEREGKPD
jgi:hypothetical protein